MTIGIPIEETYKIMLVLLNMPEYMVLSTTKKYEGKTTSYSQSISSCCSIITDKCDGCKANMLNKEFKLFLEHTSNVNGRQFYAFFTCSLCFLAWFHVALFLLYISSQSCFFVTSNLITLLLLLSALRSDTPEA